MVARLYLDDDTAKILQLFGNINDVVNRIIDIGMQGAFEIMDKPVAPPREECKRYEVVINNKDYLSLIAQYPDKSPRTSLRRLVFWFVSNEMYNELGWKITCDDKKKMLLIKRLDETISVLFKNKEKFLIVKQDLFYNAIESCKTLISALQEIK